MADTPAGAPRLIRRYENRKLYDARARRYVTLDQLAERISAGEELQVVERATGEDITNSVMAQLVFEGIKNRDAEVPRQVLARLIRFGRRKGAPLLAWSPPRDAASRARDEAERIVSDLVRRGRLSLEEALALRQEIAESIQRIATEAQQGVEQRLKGLLDSGHDPQVQPAMRRLKERLMEVETWIDGAPAPRTRSAPRAPARRRSRGPGRS